jgi:hypothetical protein
MSTVPFFRAFRGQRRILADKHTAAYASKKAVENALEGAIDEEQIPIKSIL